MLGVASYAVNISLLYLFKFQNFIGKRGYSSMKRLNKPFNIRLLDLTPDKLKLIKPVTSLDIFDHTKTNFHDEGLYSVAIFGRIGDPMRDKRFSYIDVKIPIFHPIIFRCLKRIKALYIEIIEGSSYAIFDNTTNDFVKSTQEEGETGFAFFLKHWKKIEFVVNESITRIESIKLIEKYKEKALTSKVVVLPAGLRDIEYENGRVTEEEINDYYRRLLSISNTITEQTLKSAPELLNRSRVSLQRAFNELYDYIESLLEGKKKFILGKWASRRIQNSTRNVINAMSNSITNLDSPDNPDINTTIVGLYQACKAVLPVTKYCLRTGFLSKVFTAAGAPVRLVNKKTLKSVELNLPAEHFDTFMSEEGLDKLLNLFGEDSIRHKPIEIEGHYLGLIYKGNDNTFKIIQDIDEVPSNRSKAEVYPLTFAELLYISVYKDIEKYPANVVRYPITSTGSSYFSFPKVVTTSAFEERVEIGEDWLPTDNIAKRFPVRGSAFVNSFSPGWLKLSELGADSM